MLAAVQAFIIYALLEYLDPDTVESHVGYRHMAELLVSKILSTPRLDKVWNSL